MKTRRQKVIRHGKGYNAEEHPYAWAFFTSAYESLWYNGKTPDDAEERLMWRLHEMGIEGVNVDHGLGLMTWAEER